VYAGPIDHPNRSIEINSRSTNCDFDATTGDFLRAAWRFPLAGAIVFATVRKA
jgi:hypothetical protein